jgi:hypothetical protein
VQYSEATKVLVKKSIRKDIIAAVENDINGVTFWKRTRNRNSNTYQEVSKTWNQISGKDIDDKLSEIIKSLGMKNEELVWKRK